MFVEIFWKTLFSVSKTNHFHSSAWNSKNFLAARKDAFFEWADNIIYCLLFKTFHSQNFCLKLFFALKFIIQTCTKIIFFSSHTTNFFVSCLLISQQQQLSRHKVKENGKERKRERGTWMKWRWKEFAEEFWSGFTCHLNAYLFLGTIRFDDRIQIGLIFRKLRAQDYLWIISRLIKLLWNFFFLIQLSLSYRMQIDVNFSCNLKFLIFIHVTRKKIQEFFFSFLIKVKSTLFS